MRIFFLELHYLLLHIIHSLFLSPWYQSFNSSHGHVIKLHYSFLLNCSKQHQVVCGQSTIHTRTHTNWYNRRGDKNQRRRRLQNMWMNPIGNWMQYYSGATKAEVGRLHIGNLGRALHTWAQYALCTAIRVCARHSLTNNAHQLRPWLSAEMIALIMMLTTAR